MQKLDSIDDTQNFVSLSYDFNEMLEKRPSKLGRASLGGGKLDESGRKQGGSNSNLFEPQINF